MDENGQPKDVNVTIAGVTMEEFGKGNDRKEQKLVLAFVKKKKGMVCNKTNAKTISKILGSEDTDDWIGRTITIGPREVEFQGDMVWSLRVSLKLPTSASAPAQQSAPTSPLPPAMAHPRAGQPENQHGSEVSPEDF